MSEKRSRKPKRSQKQQHHRTNNSKKSNSLSGTFSRNRSSSWLTFYIVLAFLVALCAFLVTRSEYGTPVREFWENLLGIETHEKEEPAANKDIHPAQAPVEVALPKYSPECHTEAWLNRNGSIPGYHVLCVKRVSEPSTQRVSFEIEFYREGVLSEGKRYTSDAEDIESMRAELERVLKIKNTESLRQEVPKYHRPQPWALFTEFGFRIEGLGLAFQGTVLVFEGGQFIYPPIERGFKRNVTIMNPMADKEIRPHLTFELETLATQPVILLVHDFIPQPYCDHVVNISEPHMARSTVSHMSNTAGDSNQWRTSSTHWLNGKGDRVIQDLDKMTAAVTRVPESHQESVQVLRYTETQQYDSHWDYFDESLYRGTQMERKIRGGRNRLATLFWYMSDVKSGGETYFPRAGGLAQPRSLKLKRMEDCGKSGIAVQPKKGNAVLFYGFKPSGQHDPLSLHGGCPVGPGNVKWAGNKWIWTRPINS